MRIAIFHDLPSGGAKRALHGWVTYLRAKHDIDVYTLTSADNGYCNVEPLVNNHIVINFEPHKIYAHPWGRLNQIQRYLDLNELDKIGVRIADMINFGNYDLLFAQPCQFTSVPLLLHHVRIPVIYYFHEPIKRNQYSYYINRTIKPDHYRNNYMDRVDPFIRMYFNSLSKHNVEDLQSVSTFLANSEYTREKIYQEFQIDSTVCYLGVNKQDFFPEFNLRKDKSVIAVGELTPRKGYSFIVNSLAKIPAYVRPALKIVCNSIDVREKAYIEEIASKQGVVIRILNNLNTDQLRMEYNKSDVCIFAAYNEPFGLVPLEAMACGIPVVAVNEGGVVETVLNGYSGYLVNRDIDQFARVLSTLIQNPKLRTKLGKQARQLVVDKWSLSQATSRLENNLLSVKNSGKVINTSGYF